MQNFHGSWSECLEMQYQDIKSKIADACGSHLFPTYKNTKWICNQISLLRVKMTVLCILYKLCLQCSTTEFCFSKEDWSGSYTVKI